MTYYNMQPLIIYTFVEANKSNTRGVGTAYPSGAAEFIPGF